MLIIPPEHGSCGREQQENVFGQALWVFSFSTSVSGKLVESNAKSCITEKAYLNPGLWPLGSLVFGKAIKESVRYQAYVYVLQQEGEISKDYF